jgi:hypothetical protein
MGQHQPGQGCRKDSGGIYGSLIPIHVPDDKIYNQFFTIVYII